MKDLARALSVCVRCMSLRQVADSFTRSDLDNARRALKGLKHWVVEHQLLARVTPKLIEPLIGQDDDNPDFEAVSYALVTRQGKAITRMTTMYCATPQALKVFGGRAKLRPHQVSHDLGVSAIYLKYLEQWPELAQAWRGEDFLRWQRFRQTLPDAFVGDVCVEYGGCYSPERVQSLFEDCIKRKVRLELW